MEPKFDWTETVAERKIKDAMEAGEFDNLPGKGQPLDLEVNPFESPSQRVANRILKNARALPEWLQLEKDIEREREVLASAQERARRALRHARGAATRERILERFRREHQERLDLLNTLILHYNYIAPAGAQRTFATYSIKKEMAALDNEMASLDADLPQT